MAETVKQLREKLALAEKQIADLCDPTLKSMRFEDGRFNVELGGEVVNRLALILAGWFREGGATNYVEMHLHAKEPPFERYTVTVQKYGEGAKTPHELRREAEAALSQEREACAKVAETRAAEYRAGPHNSIVLDGMTHQERCDDYAIACETVAAAIRARAGS